MGFMDQFNQSFLQQQQPIPQLQRPAVPQITASPFPSQQPMQSIVEGEPGEELFNAFKHNVLNPPERTQMTYPPNILAGLTKALDVARTPTDYEKNRVFVDGNAYQKGKVFTDAEGKQHFIEPYKQPGFMQNVMQAMPEAVSVAPAVLNQKRADEMADWDLKNKGLSAAINAQSSMELARQRGAYADYLEQKPDIERDKVAISRLTAEERVRVSRLKTLTDRELEQMRIDGRITIAEYNAVQAMRRVEAHEAAANQRNAATNASAEKRVGMQQEGATERSGAGIASREKIAEQEEAGRNTRSSQSSAGNYPSQDKVRTQKRVSEALAANPEWKKNKWVEFDDNGFPVIKTPEERGGPDEMEYRRMRDVIFPQQKKDVNLPAQEAAPITAPSPINLPSQAERDQKFPPNPVPVAPPTNQTPKVNPPGGRGNKPAAAPPAPTSGTVRVQAPDGRTGTWDYSKGPLPKDWKVIGK